jgi:hypothetical protein
MSYTTDIDQQIYKKAAELKQKLSESYLLSLEILTMLADPSSEFSSDYNKQIQQVTQELYKLKTTDI